jgi:hypothetical protein
MDAGTINAGTVNASSARDWIAIADRLRQCRDSKFIGFRDLLIVRHTLANWGDFADYQDRHERALAFSKTARNRLVAG